MFVVVGILLSIPVVAIIDYLIKKVFLPMRREKAKKEAEEKLEQKEKEQEQEKESK